MSKRIALSVIFAATSLAVCLAFSQTPGGNSSAPESGRIVIPVTKTSPISGKEMFVSYCAPCHGTDGRGNGPAAPALKTPPTDLTTLARKNGGKYPGEHVVTVLQFGSDFPSHGSAKMPVWGPIFGRMNVSNLQDKQMRISNLSRYLETLQVK